MRFIDIIALSKEYILIGMLAAVAVSMIFVFVYKKSNKAEKTVKWSKILWIGAMVCYLIFLFGATMMSRSGGVWSNHKFLPAFYSYKEAWIKFSASAWRNIVLNICLFLPMGFLIPIGFRKMRRLWKTTLAGFGVSFLIEITQMLLKRGISEIDDLINNTLGTMIGFGLFVIVLLAFNRLRGRETQDFRWKKMPVYQIPLLGTVLMFTVIFSSYARQELGNLPITPIIENEEEMFTITTDKVFPDQGGVTPVYQIKMFTKEEAVEYGNEILRKLGSKIDEAQNNYYEDTVFLKAPERFHINVNYYGGSFRLIDFETSYGSDKVKVRKDVTEQEARERFEDYGMEIPEEAEFIKDEETGDFIFKVSMLKKEHSILDGSIKANLYNNGCFGYIDDFIVEYDEYKDFEVISPKEAYEKMLDGEFEQIYEYSEIQVEDYDIHYMLDSKGFYQPCYAFSGKLNGEESVILIPAVEQ